MVALALILGACSLLPASAPTSNELEGSLDSGSQNYNLVSVDSRVTAVLHGYRRPTFSSRFTGLRHAASNILHSGDVVGFTIYEAGGSSLLAPQAPATPTATMPTQPVGSGVGSVPAQVIEADGTIMVPFVGRVKVSERTPAQVEAEIADKLQGKAVDPQVIVSLLSSVSNVATVGGDVNGPRSVPLTLRGERLLDVIAAAGGAKYPAYEVYVSVIRQGRLATVLLQTVVVNPSENIVVRANDQIFLTRYPRTFAVLGATTKVSQYTFDTAKVTLAEAVARAGGPIDTIGNPSGIYLFRYEPLDVAEKILGKPPAAITALASAQGSAEVKADFVPILYRVDFRTVDGYFLAQNIDMQDKDVVLVTNAEGTQIQKLLTGIRGVTGIAYDLSKNAGG